MITELVTLVKKAINDISLNFITRAQDNLEYIKNPLSMLDQTQSAFRNFDQLADSKEFKSEWTQMFADSKNASMTEFTTHQLLKIINYQESTPESKMDKAEE